MNALVVINPFGGKAIGERITAPDEIEATLAGEHVHHVVQADHDIILAGDLDNTETDETTTEEA